MKRSLAGLLERLARAVWYGPRVPGSLLAPLGWVYSGAAVLRRDLYQSGVLRVEQPSRPVIVVGNLTVGGTGKTPLVIHIAGLATSMGLRPGIVTRGYGGRCAREPRWVTAHASPDQVGDEAVLLARRTGCSVVAARDRCAAVESLVAEGGIDIVIADDGLQHYALGRDLEIGVLDAALGLGNRRCLPAGPLREPAARLETLDYLVVNGDRDGHGLQGVAMRLRPGEPVRLRDGATCPLPALASEGIHAVAGIGHPERFFHELERAGVSVERHPFPDHHSFRAADLQFADDRPVVMTEKDAVKCSPYADERLWYVPVTAELDASFDEALRGRMRRWHGASGGLSPSPGEAG